MGFWWSSPEARRRRAKGDGASGGNPPMSIGAKTDVLSVEREDLLTQNPSELSQRDSGGASGGNRTPIIGSEDRRPIRWTTDACGKLGQKWRLACVSFVNSLTVWCIRLANLLSPTLRDPSIFDPTSLSMFCCLNSKFQILYSIFFLLFSKF
jgi:hypothetical protein